MTKRAGVKAIAYRAKLNCGHCSVEHKLNDGLDLQQAETVPC
jgi:hypothetical protein